jgi:long-chain acyl-CoA synthetase
MNLGQKFYTTALNKGDSAAIYYEDSVVSYGKLLNYALRFRDLLKNKAATKRGDRVCLLIKNRPEFISVLFSIWFSDCVVVPINIFLKPAEVDYILKNSGASVIFVDADTVHVANELRKSNPSLVVFNIDDQPDSSPHINTAVECFANGSDPAVIIYTSGTTGKPKGAMLSHHNLFHNVSSCYRALEFTEDERIAVVLPMFHSFMMTVGILLPLLNGASIVLSKSFHPLKTVIEDIIKWKATLLPAMPQIFRAFLHPSVPQDLPLRLCVSGSAPLPLDTLEHFNKKFKFPLIEGYGLSEASPVCSVNPIKGPWKAGSIGIPIPDVEMSVQDENGNLLPPGVVGEICVRGGNVMLGYWNMPEETARAFRNGWLLTGDVGYYDNHGYFYITDRKKDMLLVNGNNVYPREIEEVILKYGGIKEAAVIGKRDPRRGEQPIAYISLNDGVNISIDDLLKYLRKNLADYKVPRKVYILEELPHNATGKILKTELRLRND